MRKFFLISAISAALLMPAMAQVEVWEIHAINSLHPTTPIVFTTDFSSQKECVDFLHTPEMKISIEGLIEDEKQEHTGQDFFLDVKCVDITEQTGKKT